MRWSALKCVGVYWSVSECVGVRLRCIQQEQSFVGEICSPENERKEDIYIREMQSVAFGVSFLMLTFQSLISFSGSLLPSFIEKRPTRDIQT